MQRKNHLNLFLLFLFTVGFTKSHASSRKTKASSEAPYLLITLTPVADGATFKSIEVVMQIQSPHLSAGATLLRMPLVLVGCPSAAYSASDIHASDAKGPLRLTSVDEPATPHDTTRHWTIDRSTVGDVSVRYGTPPQLDSITPRNSPLYDLRAQENGMMGAGHYFIAIPAKTDPYSITLRWDLSRMPAGARGVWSLGEGTQHTVSPAAILEESYYAAGIVHSEPESGDGKFTFYWMGAGPPDVRSTARDLRDLYKYMSKFFHDEQSSYRIFFRANPYPNFGGTALAHSFMYGLKPRGDTDAQRVRTYLAHEMVHNWPTLFSEDYSETAWYMEGTADYYSAVLPLRAGLISKGDFLSLVNEHAQVYYTSPYRGNTNKEVAAKAWVDDDAEKVPYARGFMYLTSVDAEIRAKSSGRRSLDTLVIDLTERARRGEKVGLQDWLKLVEQELGPESRLEYEAMAAGNSQAPPVNSFGPCFRPEPKQLPRYDPGFDPMRQAIVSDLRADSPAAKAGVKEGDLIVFITSKRALESGSYEMEMRVTRGGQPLTFSFNPYGPPQPAWQWVMSDANPNAKCKLN